MSNSFPMITCRMTDEFGNEINPYSSSANLYSKPLNLFDNHWSVEIEGYIAIFSDDERISPPIPFCITTFFCLYVPKGSCIKFVLERFRVWAVPVKKKCVASIGQINLHLSFETLISSQKPMCLKIPKVDESLNIVEDVLIHTDQIFDSTLVRSTSCVLYKNALLQAEVCQYNALGDGIKRTFYNSDEIKEYAGCGIKSPDDVSYSSVFVNGILQPKQNYTIHEGEITFNTEDIPGKNRSVVILFITWKNKDFKIMPALQWQYSAISNGIKKNYDNSDEVPGYESHGIPAPNEVSYYNLYINGVLQPKSNYCVRKGLLTLTTENAPTKGSFVILESVIINDSKGRLFRASTSTYSAYSNGGRKYTDKDSVDECDLCGILGANDCSYQNLFINGVLQPQVNYINQRGCLILCTKDCPPEEAPITLASVSSSPAIPNCKYQFSDAALAHLKTILPDIEEVEQAAFSKEIIDNLNAVEL